MIKKGTRHLGAALAAVLSVLMLGCGRPAPEADFVYISTREHNSLDPQRMSWSHDIRAADNLFDTLVTYNFTTGTIEPATAKRWEVSPDGRTYTFHLREDARWSNGDPVTSHDYVYAWRRALLPDQAAQYTKLFFYIEGSEAFYQWRTEQIAQYARVRAQAGGDAGESAADAAAQSWALTEQRFAEVVGLAAPDDRTLVVTLTQPTPFFLELVAFTPFSPVHRETVEAATTLDPASGTVRTDARYWSDPARLVTNGPYVIAERRFKQYLLMRANEHYWGRAAMKNDSVMEKVVADPQTALLTYNNGEAHWWVDPPTTSQLAADLVAQDRGDVHLQPMAGTYFYDFNCAPTLSNGRANPLADARVRRALAMAINRKTIVEQVTRLGQPVAKTYIPVGALPSYDPPVEAGVSFDPEAARDLLAEAGYPDGAGLDGLSILYNTGAGHEMVAQAIAEMWQTHLGVAVTLEGVELNTFSQRKLQHDFTISRASWYGDYPDPTTWLQKMTTGDGNNDPQWANAEFDALLAKAETIRDEAQRMAVLREAEAVLLRDQPMAMLFQYLGVYLYDPERVSGLEPTGWSRWRFENVAVTPK